jgi:TolB protein
MKYQTITLLFLSAVARSLFAQEEIDLERKKDLLGFPPPIPVTISGFTGEVDSVLKNDLLFMGFKFVTPDQAKFLINGKSAGNVEGYVTDRINRNTVLSKAYSGNSLRAQTHAFADDIALTLTGKPGIAQTKITFKGQSGGMSEIYIADFDGFNPRAATQDGTLVVAPCWAGRSALYYASYKLGKPYIYYHNLGTGERRTVASFPGLNTSPTVSPDGKRLAMILSKSGSPDLYVSDLNGGNLRQLTRTREEESSPCWAPDSQRLCFVSRASGIAALYVISADGGAMHRLSTLSAPTPTEPDWSPDGRWIAFTSLAKDFRICIVPAEGGTVHVVADGEDPSWAPNSRALIFCHGPDRAKKLSLLDVPTKQVKDLPRVLGSNSQPSWGR